MIQGTLIRFAWIAVMVATTLPAWAGNGRNLLRDSVKVMTRNLYLGTSINPILAAPPEQIPIVMAQGWAQVLSIDFNERAAALADDLRRLIWLLDGSSLVVSPDTGPLHISRAVDTPVVGLYGYTNPKRAGPYRKYQDLVADGYAEYPGEDYPANREYRDGMKRVTLEMVLEKVDRAVSQYVTPSSRPK